MACSNCGTASCDCVVIDVTGNPDVCKQMEQLIQDNICQLACDIHDFNVCTFSGMLDILSEVLQSQCCVFNNLERWLCALEARDIAVVDTNTVNLTKTGDWQLGDEIISLKADVKISGKAGNMLHAEADGLYASRADSDGYEPVTVALSHTVPWSHFQLMYNDGVSAAYFSGAAGNEDFFTIPKASMDIVDTFVLQTKVTGNFVVSKTADVQTAQDMGNNFRLNIDVYLHSSVQNFTNAPNKSVVVDAIAFGRKKIVF